MLLRFFRKASWHVPVLLAIMGVLLWLVVFLSPAKAIESVEAPAGPFFELIRPFIYLYPLPSVIIAFTFLMIQVFAVNQAATSNAFTDRYSAIPGLIYLLLMSSTSAMISPNPVLFANLFLIPAMSKMFHAHSELNTVKEVFNVGFLVAVAGLFYFPAIAFFLCLVMVIVKFYLPNLRTLLAALVGLAAPFAFLALYFFIKDELMVWLDEFVITIEPLLVLELETNIYQKAFIAVLGLLSVFSFLRLQLIFKTTKPIRIRNRITILLLFFLTAVVSYLVAVDYIYVHFGMLMIPLSIALSVFFYDLNNKKLAEILFGILLIMILASRFAGYFFF